MRREPQGGQIKKVEKRVPECEQLSMSDSKEREVAKMMLDNKNEQK